MNQASAKKLVLVSMVGLLILAVYRSKSADTAIFKQVWGVGVIGLFLSVTADFAPTVAGPFALLVLLGSLTNGGDQAIQNALSGLSAKLPAPATPSAGAAPAATPTAPSATKKPSPTTTVRGSHGTTP